MNIFRLIKRKFRVKFGKDIGVLIPDVEELKEEVPYVEPVTWHFRCPCCGYAHKMFLTADIKLKQDETLNNLYIEVTNLAGLHIVPYGPMFHQLIEGKSSEYPPEIEIPCMHCGEESPRWKWHDAYKNAYRHLDMDGDQLCHCGGELYMEQIPGTPKYGMVCERCSWVKPRAIISGTAVDNGEGN
ncbi:hypothetical protein ACK8P5_26385 (plasmid) [Paenibacillus sp. EC2-1]|uniref:hypothetical protein n=1 Tax=Paenibacillus sp. EC2-1 TaxID=3388665 RepID=UPI003BEEC3E5